MARASPSPSRSPSLVAPSAEPGRSLLWLQGLLCGVLAALATPTALVLGALLAPGIVAVALDRAPGRPVARSMLLFGLSATVVPLISLWKTGHTLEVASALASDPGRLAIAWAAAGAGWLLAQLAPTLVRLALDSAAVSRRRRLQALRARYAEEWGVSDAGGDAE